MHVAKARPAAAAKTAIVLYAEVHAGYFWQYASEKAAARKHNTNTINAWAQRKNPLAPSVMMPMTSSAPTKRSARRQPMRSKDLVSGRSPGSPGKAGVVARSEGGNFLPHVSHHPSATS